MNLETPKKHLQKTQDKNGIEGRGCTVAVGHSVITENVAVSFKYVQVFFKNMRSDTDFENSVLVWEDHPSYAKIMRGLEDKDWEKVVDTAVEVFRKDMGNQEFLFFLLGIQTRGRVFGREELRDAFSKLLGIEK